MPFIRAQRRQVSTTSTRFDREGVDEVDSPKSKCRFCVANCPKTVGGESSSSQFTVRSSQFVVFEGVVSHSPPNSLASRNPVRLAYPSRYWFGLDWQEWGFIGVAGSAIRRISS